MPATVRDSSEPARGHRGGGRAQLGAARQPDPAAALSPPLPLHESRRDDRDRPQKVRPCGLQVGEGLSQRSDTWRQSSGTFICRAEVSSMFMDFEGIIGPQKPRKRTHRPPPNGRHVIVLPCWPWRKEPGGRTEQRPARGDPSVVMQALKISAARRMRLRPFWQHRFYGLNVFTGGKRAETRRCVHRNPFTRNLVAPERVDRVELLAPGMRRNRRGRDRVDVDVR